MTAHFIGAAYRPAYRHTGIPAHFIGAASEAAPIKCAGRESASLLALCIGDSVSKPALSTLESVGLPADSLPAHFLGAASERS